MAGYKEDMEQNRLSAERKKQRYGHTLQRITRGSFLSKLGPKRGYHFHSDYFDIDDGFNGKGVATILRIFHRAGADRNLVPMWGLSLIPQYNAKDDKVTIRLLEQMNTVSDSWFEKYRRKSDKNDRSERSNAKHGGDNKQKTLYQYAAQDRDIIQKDHMNGDAYMYATMELYIKADSIDAMDRAVDYIKDYYRQQFGGIYVTAFEGQQRDSLQRAFLPGDAQLGKHPWMFTSTEMAGAYNIATHGLSDNYGEYVGRLEHEISQSAILWDIDSFRDHAVIASDFAADTLTPYKFPRNTRGAGMWAAKIAQAAIVNGHRVVHLVLNHTDVANIGANFSKVTTKVEVDKTTINPFEIFGKDEQTAFVANKSKLRLMAKQISSEVNDTDINTNLDEIIESFYRQRGLWVKNANKHPEDIKTLNLPHDQYPLLERFVAYFAPRRREALENHDTLRAESIDRLSGVFTAMLGNGAIFNSVTSDRLDSASPLASRNKDVVVSPQVIYDFSSLFERDNTGGIAMAGFVNVLSFAVGNLEADDVLILHGADLLTESVMKYVTAQLETLRKHEVRVVYTYDSIDYAIKDRDFNGLSESDFTLFGLMSNTEITAYEKAINQKLPEQLSSNLVAEGQHNRELSWFLHRGVDNIIFSADPVLTYVWDNLKPYLKTVHYPNGATQKEVVIDYPGKDSEKKEKRRR